jgi:hypothetical protein
MADDTLDHRNDPAVRVHVVEHALFDRLDFELRVLLERLPDSPRALTILNFLDPRGASEEQIVLVYQPDRRHLKRLHQRFHAANPGACRLEVWDDVGPEQIHDLMEITFLEKTRPATLEPEVFLGVLESLIERGRL